MKDTAGSLMDYPFNMMACVSTAILSFILFVIILIRNNIKIYLATPVQLLGNQHKGDGEPKNRYLFLLLGFILLSAGYAIALTIQGILSSLIYFFSAALLVLLGTYLLQTVYMRKFVYNLAQRFKAHKTKDWLAKLETLNQGLALLYKKPTQSFIVFIESGLSLLCLYCIAPALMFAFTNDVPIITILDRMILLNLILYFAPTPGGTGIAEGLFILLFAPFVPSGTVGIIAVAWRVMAEYVPFFIGMYAVLTLYGRQFVAQETSN